MERWRSREFCKYKPHVALLLLVVTFVVQSLIGTEAGRLKNEAMSRIKDGEVVDKLERFMDNTAKVDDGSIVKDDHFVPNKPPRPQEQSDKKPDADALLVSNSSEYTWMGNHFVPPEGVPTFRPPEYLSYFSKRNTLFIGDSTGRRAYGTLFGIITSRNHADIKTSELDSKDAIDFNKPFNKKERCMIPERGLHGSIDYVCRNILNDVHLRSDEDLLAHSDKNSTNTSTITPGGNEGVESSETKDIGKFDYIRRDCLREIYNLFAANSTHMMKDYDLIVISAGIWEGIRQSQCRMRFSKTLSNEEKYDVVLDTLSSISSMNLQIVFRTPGKI